MTRTPLQTAVAEVIGGDIGAVVANVVFGDPAVTLSTDRRSGPGRTESFAGIAPRSAPTFVLMRCAGAFAVVRVLYPRPHHMSELLDA